MASRGDFDRWLPTVKGKFILASSPEIMCRAKQELDKFAAKVGFEHDEAGVVDGVERAERNELVVGIGKSGLTRNIQFRQLGPQAGDAIGRDWCDDDKIVLRNHVAPLALPL